MAKGEWLDKSQPLVDTQDQVDLVEAASESRAPGDVSVPPVVAEETIAISNKKLLLVIEISFDAFSIPNGTARHDIPLRQPSTAPIV